MIFAELLVPDILRVVALLLLFVVESFPSFRVEYVLMQGYDPLSFGIVILHVPLLLTLIQQRIQLFVIIIDIDFPPHVFDFICHLLSKLCLAFGLILASIYHILLYSGIHLIERNRCYLLCNFTTFESLRRRQHSAGLGLLHPGLFFSLKDGVGGAEIALRQAVMRRSLRLRCLPSVRRSQSTGNFLQVAGNILIGQEVLFSFFL